ncbi:TetR/AcrR family transcriptional regulator C-terminal domain-containing protein [Streptomyces venetus]|uniref:TetR/AcrR family transcriptional regulator C-terminal domain-containing protein n=1 Tax=Streptomyces venetus TaxID=1701086 RepID=UPI003C306405
MIALIGALVFLGSTLLNEFVLKRQRPSASKVVGVVPASLALDRDANRTAHLVEGVDDSAPSTSPSQEMRRPRSNGCPRPRTCARPSFDAGRSWVQSVRTNREVAALRNLVAAEAQRFPELGRAWRRHGSEGHHPTVAKTPRTLVDQGRLVIPDLEAAIIQLYALLVLPIWSSAPTAHISTTTSPPISSPAASTCSLATTAHGPRNGYATFPHADRFTPSRQHPQPALSSTPSSARERPPRPLRRTAASFLFTAARVWAAHISTP